MVWAVVWSVKYCFSPNSPILRKSRGEEDRENRQMQNVLSLKQTQKCELVMGKRICLN